ncbi:4-(cytidine 5'-diphospho)-2-C-methyl-D-erythritol kinase [Methyloversatilis thermotolerans]|uniref:4-(cytidine 5'-diphospho)-2-C-methyl-D-erythritol kinase n=1 Tax=Methyloversatilis thermotolerans TaxID=1346290 RepID=UPI000368069A|nr:4-(cytidine 5'-diphospho)-2-C-methyl-D-erythritol kinase [Methyloversatilis thermotolerans]
MVGIDWGRWLPAPAKINLFLHVTGRRADGYHLLQTVFRFLDHGDRLRFSRRDDGVIRRVGDIPGVAEQDDLCVRAARLLQQHTGCALGVDIELDKVLPMGGGLGGGSSDAATVLLALNRLWRLDLPLEALQALGLSLGADVPVFVSGRSAFAEGVGERLQALSLPPAAYLVIAPGVSIPTPRIFSDPELTRNSDPCKIADFAAAASGSFPRLYGRNDLEAVAKRLYPEVDHVLKNLAHRVDERQVRMSGSGACVFVQCPDVVHAQNLKQATSAQWPATWRGFVAEGVDLHPLHAAAGW